MRDELTWPLAELGEALQALAREAGLPLCVASLGPAPVGLSVDGEPVDRWVSAAALALGLEAERVHADYAEIEVLLRGAAPAMLNVDGRVLLVLGRRRRSITVLGSDLKRWQVSLDEVRRGICAKLESTALSDIRRLLDRAHIAGSNRASVEQALLREQLAGTHVEGGWLLRAPPGARFWGQLGEISIAPRLMTLGAAYAGQYALGLLSWWLIGRGALDGRVDRGWLWAWALILLTLVPLRLLATWAGGMLAIDVGALLKRRLLAGALALRPEEIRHQGAGQLLGRVIESEAVESLAQNAGVLGLLSVLELGMTAIVLGLGAGGVAHLALLAGWTAFAVALGWRYFRRRQRWTRARLVMTLELVEGMVGHRTRVAQETNWHDGEDETLDSYLRLSRELDAASVWVLAILRRGWIVVGLLCLFPAFVAGGNSTARLAIALGGILLGTTAFGRLAQGLASLAALRISWREVAELFAAAARSEPAAMPALALANLGPDRAGRDRAGDKLLEIQELVFRYGGRAEPVLGHVNLTIQRGDRILLEGPSGGGKSTLGALAAGLRQAESGLLLLDGLDRRTLGSEGWRRQVVSAPQFHENHVFGATFAFNLLMGRNWPPRSEDLDEAVAICNELGLGDSVARMPAGLQQNIGETGWQLSHGEKSRLYIARALLQRATLLVLDESFAALDPENQTRALRCVLARAPTLLVIAHP